ncbi:MAG TPA: phosphopantothenate/pantothenate synthetase [archaeon]|nr:phosphopantothenate/pantothenate synthetase [archaeon]
MIPKNHPRHESLRQRHLIEEGVKSGIVTPTGMIAQGRGEAFDYLLGEKTAPEAILEIEASACMLLLAKKPVISVNGNVTVLCAKEIVQLAKILGAKIEANVFYAPIEKRKKVIAKEFKKYKMEVLYKSNATIPNLTSDRRNVSREGIFSADVVLIMLEDGDRTEALMKFGKKTIAIDLNPKSRTAQKASVTIVDNVVRAIPLLVQKCIEFRKKDEKWLKAKLKKFKNKIILNKILQRIRQGGTVK